MESVPRIENKDKEEKAKIGNLLKANIMFLVYQLSVNVHDPVLTQYIYQRYSDEVFDNSTKSATTANQTSKCYVNESDPGYMLQERVQHLTSNCQTILVAIGNSTALISCMFLGAYSDFLGRRFLFICPLVGQILKNVLTIFVIYWNLDLKYLFVGEVIEGVSGGYNGVILASYAYTADNTPPKNSRTVGIAVIDFTTYLSTAASQVITGYFIKDLGYLYPSITTTSLMFLSLILVIVLLPETVNKDRRSQYPSPLKAVKNVFGFYFSKDFGQRRRLFWLSVTTYFLTYFSVSGVFFLEYLFQLNLPFCWGPVLIGYFNMALALSRQVLGIPVIKLLHLCTSDPEICIITSVILAASYVLNGAATTDVMLFLTVLPSGIAAPLLPTLRAVMSRMAPPEMQGSLFAGIGLVNIISSGTGSTVFNEMYNATVKMLRGFIFFTGAGCQLLCAFIMVVFLWIARRGTVTDTSADGINNNN
ncbi:lysosomal proton-coupled steroid conjugate and bile acid symporter SLC46A3-like [Haliotis asinina]|uniref:lysosomal proton-coupled steroid conjugate and bile acid symporter SLC46A3-like n=1 Tax=Haliotis asinina TaxID=109174 RepID=UPI00353190F1